MFRALGRLLPGAAVAIVVILAGCGKPSPGGQQPPTAAHPATRLGVVATIYPLADWARQIGGDLIDARSLLKPGSNPHTYEPATHDGILVAQSRVLFGVGLGLEDWVRDLGAAAGFGGPRIVYLADALKPAQIAAGDPHVWLDPALAARMVGGMADVLAEVDPPHAADYKRGGHAYAARLRKLSDWCVARLSSLPVKKVVVYHPAFGYLFRKCGLQVLGALETSPGREASTSELVDIVRKMKQENSQVIFVEPQFSFKLAQVLADETGARLVTLDDIGDPADPRRDTYVHLMEYNVAQVVAALGGKTGPPPDL